MNKFYNSLLIILTFCFLLPTSYLFAQPGWSEDMRLTFDYAYNADPKAACCGDTIHLVWWKNYLDSLSNYRDEVFYRRSTDEGLTWGDDVLLSIENDDASVQPMVGVNDEFVHVVWKDEHAGVCYRKSTDGGDTWLQIDTLPNAGLSQPWICVDSNYLYVVSGGGNGMQMFTKSTDNGESWQTGQEVMHSCGFGRITKMDSLLLVLSHQDDPYSVEIYCVRSFDDGQTWDDVQCISQYDSVSGQRPAMDTDDSSGIHITWYDYKYSPYPWTGDIFYRVSKDSGNSWEEIDSLTVMHRATASDILAEKNNVHLVWQDDRNGFDDNFEIYYRMSSDLGQFWGTEVRLTNASFHSRWPSLAYSGDFLHLFWSDQRDNGNSGPWMLYYKRKDLSQAIGETNMCPLSSTLQFDVYPNPFSMETEIKLQFPVDSRQKSVVSVKLYDVIGKEVVCYDLSEKPDRVTIDTKDLPCGVYFVQIQAGEESGIRKVIKIE